jgi:hypothetical protein
LAAYIQRDDVGAFLGETHRVGPALATGCAGDERNLALQQLTKHRLAPS